MMQLDGAGLAGWLGTLSWGDIPAWVTTFIALGGVIFGALNLVRIERRQREAAELERQDRIESQARLVWWMSPDSEYTFLPDGSRSVSYEVHNDSDRPIFGVFASHQIQQRQFTSTIMNIARPHSSVTLEMVYPKPPESWTRPKLQAWRRLMRPSVLWFTDVNGRDWALLSSGDDPRLGHVPRREVSKHELTHQLRRQHWEELDPDTDVKLPEYDAVEALVVPIVARDPYSSGHGFINRTAEDIAQDESVTESIVRALIEEQRAEASASLWTFVNMVVERARPDFALPDRNSQ